MASVESFKVSSSGQMSLPAAVRHRWRLDQGGRVDVLDLPHHSDPFDRMLIAQARAETLTLLSVDRRFPEYDVELLPLA